MGGGAIRAASKLAGIAANTCGFRGFAAERLPFSSASRTAGPTFPAAAEDVNLVASKSESVVPKHYSDIDDWVFPEQEEEVVVASAGEPMSRVIFGGAPTLEEAKEATSELTVALQQTYLSSQNSIGYKGKVEELHNGPTLPRLDKQIAENKACVDTDSPATMAFKILNESAVAQNVVASIASDPNVWNAVSQNSELQEFLRSQRACSFGDNHLNNMKSVADSDCSSVKSSDDNHLNNMKSFADFDCSSVKSSNYNHLNNMKSVADSDCSSVKSSVDSSGPDNDFMDILQDIKGTVVDMMSDLSDFFQGFFGGKGVRGIFVNSDGTARLSGEALMEGSFMGLAVMAILVILLKRV